MRTYIYTGKGICCHCGEKLEQITIGLPDDQQAHAECEGRVMADRIWAAVMKEAGLEALGRAEV